VYGHTVEIMGQVATSLEKQPESGSVGTDPHNKGTIIKCTVTL